MDRHIKEWTGLNFAESQRANERQTEETMDRQHQRVDRPELC